MRLDLIVSCIKVFRIVYAISPISGAPFKDEEHESREYFRDTFPDICLIINSSSVGWNPNSNQKQNCRERCVWWKGLKENKRNIYWLSVTICLILTFQCNTTFGSNCHVIKKKKKCESVISVLNVILIWSDELT